MMKKISFWAGVISVFTFGACTEVGPSIDFGSVAVDTTYTGTAESPMPRKVLMEEFTGVSCPPCPNGHRMVASIKSNLGGNLVSVAYHIFNFPQGSPVEENGVLVSKYDFRLQESTDVGKEIFGGIAQMPTGVVDRVPVGNDIQLGVGNWSNAASNRAAVAPPLNLYLTITNFDSTTGEGKVRAKIVYNEDVSVKQNIVVMITEDDVEDAQKDGLTVVEEYTHEHITRDIVTSIYGVTIPEKVNPRFAGRVYERTFDFKLDKAWVAKHCNIVVFVHNDDASNKEVAQAEEIRIIQ